MFKGKIIFILILALTLSALPLAGWAPVAQAHGESAITVTPDTVAPGGKITVKGVDMGANEEFKIVLEGLNYQAELGDATADDQEEFTVEFTIPADAPESVYQLKAVGEDGDVVTTELTITRPGPASNAPAETSPYTNENQMPSAAEHGLPRSRTPLEVIGLFALVIVTGGLGMVLIRWK